MAEYHITTFGGAPLSACPTIIRRRFDAASAVFVNEVRESIAAYAMLDTPAGVAAFAEAERVRDIGFPADSPRSISVKIARRTILLERVA